MGYSELVVMLTYQDYTVTDASRIFDASKNTKAECWGFKELPLTMERMKDLSFFLKSFGKTVFFEVVAYTEDDCLNGAMKAVECGVDYLIGTSYFDSVNKVCQLSGIRYMPYVGRVSGRPSVLYGSADEIIQDAQEYMKKGVYGINLLGYRFGGDTDALIRQVLNEMRNLGIPVCLTGSVDSYPKLDVIRETAPRFFTIGSAFFDHRFGNRFAEQVDRVCGYMKGEAATEGMTSDQ